MNKSILKVILRKIKDQKSQFFSLVAISAIGVAMFTGVLSVPSIMQKNAQNYFQQQNLADITITKADGFSKSDINKIKDTYPNSTIEKTTMFDSLIDYNDEEFIARIHTNKNISKPNIVEGRDIKKDNECLVDQYGHKLLNKEVTIDALQQKKKCKVVGIANSSEYFNATQKGFSSASTGEVKTIMYVSQKKAESFLEYAPIKINQIYLTLNDKPTNDTYSDKYKDYINKKSNNIENKFKKNEVTVTSRTDNNSVSSYYDDSSRISEIAAVFPVIFFLVAALVGSSTMSRMIEDDRSQIGVLSAMGYGRTTITTIYLFFALIAVLIGFVIGTVAGFNLIPPVVMQAYSVMYILPESAIFYNNAIIIQALVIALVMIVGSTLVVTLLQTKDTCATLMRPKAPLAGKKIFLEKIPFIWNRFSFLRKVSTRNLFRYKKRLIMTILAIMGCSGLLMTGLGIRTSVTPIIKLQFEKINKYQTTIYTEDIAKSDINNKEKAVLDIKEIKDALANYKMNGTTNSASNEYKFSAIVPHDSKRLNNFVNFNGQFTDNDVFVSQKLAQSLNIKANDKIEFKLDDKEYTFKVTKIVEQYIGNYIYINKDAFSKQNNSFKYNSMLIKHNSTEKVINDKLVDNDFIKAIEHSESFKNNVNTSLDGINNLVFIMIAFAGLLVVVVMYSLTNINLTERQRELATLKVLGFYDKEVSSYVFKENIILTLMGLAIGLVFGKFLHIYIISMAELPDMFFLKTQPVVNYLLTIAITIAFSLSVNLLMKHKIKKINMVDSLKSVE